MKHSHQIEPDIHYLSFNELYFMIASKFEYTALHPSLCAFVNIFFLTLIFKYIFQHTNKQICQAIEKYFRSTLKMILGKLEIYSKQHYANSEKIGSKLRSKK